MERGTGSPDNELQYNCLGLLKSETDATGAETGYAYDGLHRLIKTFLLMRMVIATQCHRVPGH